jgi:protein TonB
MTACIEIRARHTSCLSTAIIIAVAIHAVAFALWPKYVPRAYRPRIVIPQIVDPEYDIEIPPKPQEIAPPEVPVDIVPSDDVDPGQTIAPSIFDPRVPAVVPPALPEQPRWFPAFETPPQLIKSVTPGYPEIARKAEVEGTVMVLVTIDETGQVIDAWIGRSAADIFNDAALEAACQFEFQPALQRDIPVKATIRLTFDFRLTD